MKKLFLALLLGTMSLNASSTLSKDDISQVIHLRIRGVDDLPYGYPGSKVPRHLPYLYYWEGGTLEFNANHADWVFQLLDAEGNAAYTTFIPTGVSQIELPTTLNGEYEIRIEQGQTILSGNINIKFLTQQNQ